MCGFRLHHYFLRATAAPAERVLAMGILSVCPSRPGTEPSPGEIETPGLHRMIALWNESLRLA